MVGPGGSINEKLASLPLPLASIGMDMVLDPREVQGEGKTFAAGRFQACEAIPVQRLECSFVDCGGLQVLAARATPHWSWEEGVGVSSLTMCFSGSHQYTEGLSSTPIQVGDVFMNPRHGGRMAIGYISSVNFPVEHRRIERALRAMNGDGLGLNLDEPILLRPLGSRGAGGATGLFSFFAFLDGLLWESRYLAAILGFDEQIYRLLVLSLLQSIGMMDRLQKRWRPARTNWTPSLDDLVDYIRSNVHRNLTLTDLEGQSCYSARHLQTLFRQKFDCTPMQFVRRQRLAAAMERLQSGDDAISVTLVARDCGYRSLPSFTTDFRRQYGLNPSAVLRASRQAGGHPH